MFDVEAIKKDFPILKRKIGDKKLVYLDSAATTQKPLQVINTLVDFYQNHNANIHRGIHTLSEEATTLYEEARQGVAKFIKAKSPREIIFVRNSTEAINLVALTWGEVNLKEGDEIVLTVAEHHSNLVPWQLLAKKKGAVLKFIDIDKQGNLRLDQLKSLVGLRTKLVSVTYVSNVLGVTNPIVEVVKLAHRQGAKVLVDSSQAVPRLPVSVVGLGADFLAFTGHKMLGPTGIGVLWAREEILEALPPFMGGGDMIREVTLEDSTWNSPPHKFEAGTPNIAGAIGLGAAISYLSQLGMELVYEHERDLTAYALKRLSALEGITIYGPITGGDLKTGVISFNLNGVHAHDVAQVLDSEAIAVRSGHHCAMPLMDRLGIPACARASFYIYNTKDDVDKLIEGLKKVKKVFGV